MKCIITAYNITEEPLANLAMIRECTGIADPITYLIDIHNTGDPIGWLFDKDERGFITGFSTEHN